MAKEIAILMEDGRTRSEAEASLKRGTTIYNSVEEWIESYGDDSEGILSNMKAEYGDVAAAAKDGRITDIFVVEYEGNEYLIEEVN